MGTAVPSAAVVSLSSIEVNYGMPGIVHMNYEEDRE